MTVSWATYAELPSRHEFFNADDPQHPILLPSGVEITIKETTAERRYTGLPTEEIVFRHYIKFT